MQPLQHLLGIKPKLQLSVHDLRPHRQIAKTELQVEVVEDPLQSRNFLLKFGLNHWCSNSENTLTRHIRAISPGSLFSLPNLRKFAQPVSRYTMGQDQDMDDLSREADGDLDVDLTELSLGQRLTALSGGDPEILKERKNKRKGDSASALVPAASLTRTLIQALHSSDTKLLETCLAHSDDSIIRNTVRRLPPQSAVPLLIACMERLGRGARAGTMKGGGGGASSQRGTTLLAWVKAVLAIHNGHLMTVCTLPCSCLISSLDLRSADA